MEPITCNISLTFYADAVLFDMDGTLTDSIQAVEAAWAKVAKEIGQDPAKVIAATHGKRAIDNLAQFKPHIKAHEMDDEVAKFEESILYFADAYNLHGPGSSRASTSGSPVSSNSCSATPSLTPDGSSTTASSSRRSSFTSSGSRSRRSSFANKLSDSLIRLINSRKEKGWQLLDDPQDHLEAWQSEAASVDRSVRILPGVEKMIDSLPLGRYAVATSGAKTYAYGCMTRVGITPPPVTITADDKRLKAGKPAPDPFLLAAECLGYDASDCVVFEDSPSGIRAGLASGATVIAVCTSHKRSEIENCGAHFIVENMECVKCEFEGGKLKFTISPSRS